MFVVRVSIFVTYLYRFSAKLVLLKNIYIEFGDCPQWRLPYKLELKSLKRASSASLFPRIVQTNSKLQYPEYGFLHQIIR